MKKSLIIFPLIIGLFLIAICLYWEDANCVRSIKIEVNISEEASQQISLYQTDEKYYAFLPSYAELSNLGIKHSSWYVVYIDGERFEAGPLGKNIIPDKEYEFEIKNVIGISVCKSSLVFMKSSHIPAMSITLMDGTIQDLNADKNISKSGYMSVVEADGNVNYFGALREIHGRGNTTWGQAKKPYTIEFENDTDLLGMGSAKKYCVMANACDGSNLKNKMAFDAAKECGLPNALDSAFVDLYIDGEYLGLYLLTEAIDLGQERIDVTDLDLSTQETNLKALSNYGSIVESNNGIVSQGWKIPSSPKDNSGGYIIEFDGVDRVCCESSYFILPNGTSFGLKSPRYASQSQIAYISTLMNDIVADLDKNIINDRIDLDSWLNYYFIQELFANADIYSIYFYKDSDAKDPKVYAGPIWDVDLSMGTMFWGREENPAVFFANTHGIYEKLYQTDGFLQAVKEGYADKFRQLLIDYSTVKLDEYETLIANSYTMNYLRWKGVQYFEYDSHFETLNEHIEFLSNFLQKRIEFLDDAWIRDKDFCRVYYKSEGPALYEKHMQSVEYGEVFGEIPLPICKGFRCLGYFDSDGNLYDPTKPITDNVMYIAKWERVPTEPVEHEDFRQLTIKERIVLKLNDERAYLVFGIAVVTIMIGACFFHDFKDFIRKRRYRNGRQQ